MGSRKRDRLKQRRAAGATLKVAVVTAPSSDASGVSLARDVELLKASALYADEIELVSLGAVMIAGVAQLAGGDDQAVLALLSGLDEGTLRHLGGGKEMPENWRDVLALLSRPEAMRIRRSPTWLAASAPQWPRRRPASPTRSSRCSSTAAPRSSSLPSAPGWSPFQPRASPTRPPRTPTS